MDSKQNKSYLPFIVGGVVLTSIGFLAYSLTRPTKSIKKKVIKTNKSKTKKFEKKFGKKPIDVHLCMMKEDGFYAHVAADKKNTDLNLKQGARVVKINDKKVENFSYEEILKMLSQSPVPITIQFREFPDLEKQWTEAERLKEEANQCYNRNETGKGIELLNQAIELHPTNKIYYSNRILMYLKTEEYDKALEDCQKIRDLDPLSIYVKGHYLRGLVLYHLKRYKNAAAAFQTVVKLQPDFKNAIQRLKECQEIIEKRTNKKNENDKEKESETEAKEKEQEQEQEKDNNNDDNNNNNGDNADNNNENKLLPHEQFNEQNPIQTVNESQQNNDTNIEANN